MKVLLLTQYYPPERGAAQTRLQSLVKNLKRMDVKTEVLTCFPNYPDGIFLPGYQKKKWSFYSMDHVDENTVHRFWVYPAKGKGLGRLFNYLSFMLTAFFAPLFVARPRIVLCNIAPLFVAFPAYFLSRWWRVPFVLIIGDLWPRSVEHLNGWGSRILIKAALKAETWIYRKADVITAVTEGIAEILIREKRVPANKVVLLPNGIDTELYDHYQKVDLKQKINIEEERCLLIYPGNHGYAHALESVIETAELCQKESFSLHFLLVGGGATKERLIQSAREKKLNNMTFLPPVSPEELVGYLRSSDVGLVHVRNTPIAKETRPAKMFPMMAAARPIVYAGFGEGELLLKESGGGISCAPEDPQALKEALRGMLSLTPQERQELGEKNRRWVYTHLDNQKRARDWWVRVKEKLNLGGAE